MDDVRREFETNVFGLGRLTQLVLPGMRAPARGRIVNISSMGGRLVFPTAAGTTRASTRSRRSSDALRVEVRPFGISVVLVEPGLIRTEFESGGVGRALAGAGRRAVRAAAQATPTRSCAAATARGWAPSRRGRGRGRAGGRGLAAAHPLRRDACREGPGAAAPPRRRPALGRLVSRTYRSADRRPTSSRDHARWSDHG